jgi:hypothetical protein
MEILEEDLGDKDKQQQGHTKNDMEALIRKMNMK